MGDAYSVTSDPTKLYIWSGSAWNATSFQGPQGVPGPTGSTGPTGPAGPKGDTGTQGAQGIQGTAGATGATGPAGPTTVSGNALNMSTLGTDSLLYTRKFYTISAAAPSGGIDGDVWYKV